MRYRDKFVIIYIADFFVGVDITTNFMHFKRGMKDAFPIFLGYLAVSFTFGIAAKNSDLTVVQATLMSLLNLTSAGQFASLGIIAVSASYFEMAMTQLVINLRYSLMSSTLSQKVNPNKALMAELSSFLDENSIKLV